MLFFTCPRFQIKPIITFDGKVRWKNGLQDRWRKIQSKPVEYCRSCVKKTKDKQTDRRRKEERPIDTSFNKKKKSSKSGEFRIMGVWSRPYRLPDSEMSTDEEETKPRDLDYFIGALECWEIRSLCYTSLLHGVKKEEQSRGFEEWEKSLRKRRLGKRYLYKSVKSHNDMAT